MSIPPPPGWSENRCYKDACKSNADCAADEKCLAAMVGAPRAHSPVGGSDVLGPSRECAAAVCAADSDCTARQGGVCQMFWTAYNGPNYGTYPFVPTFKCSYHGDTCRTNADCPGSGYDQHWCAFPDGAKAPTCSPPLAPPPSAPPHV